MKSIPQTPKPLLSTTKEGGGRFGAGRVWPAASKQEREGERKSAYPGLSYFDTSLTARKRQADLSAREGLLAP